MLTTAATALRSPRATAPSATPPLMKSATMGSPFFSLSLPRNFGARRSVASACSVRGAPRMLPIALERTAPHSPGMMATAPRKATLVKTSGSRRPSGPAACDSSHGIAM